jgi:hypothetical protein
MSITALILTMSIAQRAELGQRLGEQAAESALFTTAARLIAGTYRN